jgi:hypothetical protein
MDIHIEKRILLKKQRFSLNMTSTVYAKLKSRSKQHNLSMNEFITQVLVGYLKLKEENGEQQQQDNGKSKKVKNGQSSRTKTR